MPENIWEAAKEIGKSEADATYDLYRALVSINGGRTDSLNMAFHVRVVAVGVDDELVEITSLPHTIRD